MPTGGDGVERLVGIVAGIASTYRLEEVLEAALAEAKRVAKASWACGFIEGQGHVDEPINIYRSLPPRSEAAIRQAVSRLGNRGPRGRTPSITRSHWIFPLVSRARAMGAIVLRGRRAGRPSKTQHAILSLLAAQTAIVLDNVILSHNEWTRLPNLSAVRPHLTETIARARGRVAVLFIDIDNFKRVNSRVGYVGGAELLVQFARRLKECPALQRGVLAHISGDEFLFVLSRMPDGKGSAQQTARAIQQALRTPFPVRGRTVAVTVSIGVSIHPDDARTVDELLENSGQAALLAKRAGKNAYRVFRGQRRS